MNELLKAKHYEPCSARVIINIITSQKAAQDHNSSVWFLTTESAFSLSPIIVASWLVMLKNVVPSYHALSPAIFNQLLAVLF